MRASQKEIGIGSDIKTLSKFNINPFCVAPLGSWYGLYIDGIPSILHTVPAVSISPEAVVPAIFSL